MTSPTYKVVEDLVKCFYKSGYAACLVNFPKDKSYATLRHLISQVICDLELEDKVKIINKNDLWYAERLDIFQYNVPLVPVDKAAFRSKNTVIAEDALRKFTSENHENVRLTLNTSKRANELFKRMHKLSNRSPYAGKIELKLKDRTIYMSKRG